MKPTIRLAAVAALLSALALPAQAERRIERHVDGARGQTVDRSISHAQGAHARSYARTGALGATYDRSVTRVPGSVTQQSAAVRPSGAGVERSSMRTPGMATATHVHSGAQGGSVIRTRDATVDEGALTVDRSLAGPDGRTRSVTRTYEPTP